MIATALTDVFDLDHPIVLAPMGGVSGGHLATAVSNAGGLGLVGGGYGHVAWLRTGLSRVKDETLRPWGAGLITWSINKAAFDLALSHRPGAVCNRPRGAFEDSGRYSSCVSRVRVFRVKLLGTGAASVGKENATPLASTISMIRSRSSS